MTTFLCFHDTCTRNKKRQHSYALTTHCLPEHMTIFLCFNPLTAILFFNYSLGTKLLFFHFLTWHQFLYSVSDFCHKVIFNRLFFSRPPTELFYLLKRVLVLCRNAVYIFSKRIEFATRWWKRHQDSINSTPYTNSWRKCCIENLKKPTCQINYINFHGQFSRLFHVYMYL